MGDEALVDTKLIQKPGRFGALTEKENPEKSWAGWRFVFENYMTCIDPQFGPDMDAVATRQNALQWNDAWTPDIQRRTTTLYAILVSILDGKSRLIAKRVPRRNGFELWRQLVVEYEPKTQNRHLSLLLSVVEAKSLQGCTIENFDEKVMDWLELCVDYEKARGAGR